MKKISVLVVIMLLSSMVSNFAMKKDGNVKQVELPKEIEVKIKPTDGQLKTLKKWLEKNANYQGMKHQKDVYVDNPKKTFMFQSKGFIDAYDKLRVRFQKNKVKQSSFIQNLESQEETICYKYRHIDSKTNKTLSCDELEFYAGDKNGLYEILKVLELSHIKPAEELDGKNTLEFLALLGFTKQEVVEKDRDIYLYKGFEIVIDDVKNLGVFVEVELKTKETETKKGIGEIYGLFKLVGFKKIIQFDRSYLHMLWNPKYNFSEEVNLSKV